MKKKRYISYGYIIKNGKIIVESNEADIIRKIFQRYIAGSSLKKIAEELTVRCIPYTEKTSRWDKARIARIIDNSKYIGNEEYEPIIDESTYNSAVSLKVARQCGSVNKSNKTVAKITNVKHLPEPRDKNLPINNTSITEINNEISHLLEDDEPCEELILEKIREMAALMYEQSSDSYLSRIQIYPKTEAEVSAEDGSN